MPLSQSALVFTKFQWKRRVKSAIFTDSEKILKRKISEYSKLKNEEKKYITEVFNRIRRNMMPVKMNQVSDKTNARNLWKCAE